MGLGPSAYAAYRRSESRSMVVARQSGEERSLATVGLRASPAVPPVPHPDRVLVLDLRAAYHERVRGTQGEMQQAMLVDDLFERPAADIAGAKVRLAVTFGGAAHHVGRLVDVGILQEVTGRDRSRVFVAGEILDLLERPPRSCTSRRHREVACNA
jgi:hypothetical protein